ncbi:MAG TPA: EF-P beta-lysylation protein EpmB [Steroidobacteraceae bacterium]|jgi:EF-P beta-lysylation protein EpmB|nr:EF-P beta-lysylation protein EpmB [Steroidobacteraceae bacterium]
MITTSPLSRQPEAGRPKAVWQRELAQAITDPLELCRALGLDPELALGARAALSHFPLRVPRGFLRRMRHGDPADPLLRQVLPLPSEAMTTAGFNADPLIERGAMRAPGLLHKYPGRALLITTEACAVHCRYCFRREFPYQSAHSEGGRWREALEVIAQDDSIHELILSGGDPLSLGNDRLSGLTAQLRHIPHLRRLRLHTRTPIVLPERVDDELLAWLRALPWPCVIVLHCNHANEIDAGVREATALLKSAGAVLLNQSVLLKGVNDSADALCHLSEGLWSAGVLPYYLHLLDRVTGTAHFEIGEWRARELMRQVSGRLPGYLVPRLARECPGAVSKTVLAPGWDALHSLPQP